MTRFRRFFLGTSFCLAAFSVAVACSGPSAHPAPAGTETDATIPPRPEAGSSDGASDAATDGTVTMVTDGGCLMPGQLGTQQVGQDFPGTAPEGGGAIGTGTYIMTSLGKWGAGPTPSDLHAIYTLRFPGNGTVIITGDRYANAAVPAGLANASTTQTFAAVGDELHFGLVCPATGAYPTVTNYAVSGDAGEQLVIIKRDGIGEVFTKQ